MECLGKVFNCSLKTLFGVTSGAETTQLTFNLEQQKHKIAKLPSKEHPNHHRTAKMTERNYSEMLSIKSDISMLLS